MWLCFRDSGNPDELFPPDSSGSSLLSRKLFNFSHLPGRLSSIAFSSEIKKSYVWKYVDNARIQIRAVAMGRRCSVQNFLELAVLEVFWSGVRRRKYGRWFSLEYLNARLNTNLVLTALSCPSDDMVLQTWTRKNEFKIWIKSQIKRTMKNNLLNTNQKSKYFFLFFFFNFCND